MMAIRSSDQQPPARDYFSGPTIREPRAEAVSGLLHPYRAAQVIKPDGLYLSQQAWMYRWHLRIHRFEQICVTIRRGWAAARRAAYMPCTTTSPRWLWVSGRPHAAFPKLSRSICSRRITPGGAGSFSHGIGKFRPTVLDGVPFELPPRGAPARRREGAGKSTLIKIIAASTRSTTARLSSRTSACGSRRQEANGTACRCFPEFRPSNDERADNFSSAANPRAPADGGSIAARNCPARSRSAASWNSISTRRICAGRWRSFRSR